ncbi:hypothetical protein C8R43DRAFT_241926 [Mycena crocata]|nr:hypothetical protein C8R43DRAFT_241926 [Mycena crocata]
MLLVFELLNKVGYPGEVSKAFLSFPEDTPPSYDDALEFCHNAKGLNISEGYQVTFFIALHPGEAPDITFTSFQWARSKAEFFEEYTVFVRFSSHRPVPSNLSDKIPRTALVAGIIARLQKHHFIQIRGSPASGKSVLLQLIAKALPADAPVFLWTDVWPPATEPDQRRSKREHCTKMWTDASARSKHTYLLIDEAQATYNDTVFWNSQLKQIADQPTSFFHVVLACAYGSATDYSPIRLQRHHMVSLRPQEGLVESPLGLLFTKEELDDYYELMIDARAMPRIDDPLKLLIYNWTHGYISAVAAIVTFIGSHADFIRHGQTFTWADFQKTPLLNIIQTLQLNAILARVLPTEFLAKDPRIHAVFTYLFHHDSIPSNATGGGLPSNIHQDDIHFAHKSGLLYMNRISEDGVEYTFAFPLQKVLLRNMLKPPSPDLSVDVAPLDWSRTLSLPSIPTAFLRQNVSEGLEIRIGH